MDVGAQTAPPARGMQWNRRRARGTGARRRCRSWVRHLAGLQKPAPHFDLNAIEVETPCAIPWDSLQGDNRVRYCGHCRQNVYNIGSLSRAEAVRLVSVREGRPCVRFHRRRDGTVVTADCWTRLRAARRKGLLAFAAVLIVLGAVELFTIFIGVAGLRWHLRSPAPDGPPLPTGDAPWAEELRRGLMLQHLDESSLLQPRRSTPRAPAPKERITMGLIGGR